MRPLPPERQLLQTTTFKPMALFSSLISPPFLSLPLAGECTLSGAVRCWQRSACLAICLASLALATPAGAQPVANASAAKPAASALGPRLAAGVSAPLQPVKQAVPKAAQQATPKAAAQPAQASGPASSEAAASTELPLMTREELKACIELSDSLKEQDVQLQEAARASADKRTEIDAAGEALRAQRVGINPKDRKAVEAFNDAIRLHDMRLQAFREHYDGLQERDRSLQADSARYEAQCLSKRYRPEDEQDVRASLGKR
jgi:hypothetical protein